ncbi:hypothetical protein JOC75_001205 [Metabacillus crassostreae]|nr:hypothetical protein [Metabacillus crassostreae]
MKAILKFFITLRIAIKILLIMHIWRYLDINFFETLEEIQVKNHFGFFAIILL